MEGHPIAGPRLGGVTPIAMIVVGQRRAQAATKRVLFVGLRSERRIGVDSEVMVCEGVECVEIERGHRSGFRELLSEMTRWADSYSRRRAILF